MKEINGKSIIVFFILLGIFLNCPIFRTQGQNLTESTVRGGFIVPEYDVQIARIRGRIQR